MSCMYRPAMEIFLNAKNKSLVCGDALNLVSPFPRNLDRGFNSLGARIHGHDHVEAECSGYHLGEFGEHIVVKRSAA